MLEPCVSTARTKDISSHMKKTLRAVGAAGLAAATIVTGLGFGPAATAMPTTKAEGSVEVPLTVWADDWTNYSTTIGYVSFAVSGDKLVTSLARPSGDRATAEAAATRARVPIPGTSGPIRFADNKCLPTTNRGALETCDGSTRQQWTTRTEGSRTFLSPSTNANLYFASFVVDGPKGSNWELRSLKASLSTHLNLKIDVSDVDVDAGTAMLSGNAPTDVTDVDISWTTAAGSQKKRNEQVKDGKFTHQLTDLALGTTTAHLKAWNGADVVAEADVEVKLEVAPVDAKAEFSSNVMETVQLSGTAQPNAPIEFRHGGKTIGGTTTLATGDWTGTINAPNMPGPYDIDVVEKVRNEDADTKPLTIDYGAGVTVTSPADGVEVDPADPELVIRGKAPEGTKVKVYEKGHAETQLGDPATAGSNASYHLTTVPLDDREYTLVLEGITKGYNRTRAELTVNPGKSSIADPTADVVFDADVSQKATVEGTAVKGSTITVKNGNDVLGTYKNVPQNGGWSLPIEPIGAGKHELTIEQTGIEGTQSTTIAIDYGAAVAINGPSGDITPGRTTVTGTTQDGAEVEVTAGDRTVDATVDGTTWKAEIEIAPSTTPVTVTAHQQSKGALHTEASTEVSTTGAQAALPVTIDTPANGTYKPGQTTTVSGTATAYAKVAIKNQWGATLSTRVADADGKWSFNRTYGPAAVYKLVATQTRLDDSSSSSAEFVLSPENAFKPLMLSTPEKTSTYTPGKNVLFTGTATPGATITAKSSWGSKLFETRANQSDGTWAATRGFGPSATYVITLTQTALDGTSDSISPVILQPVAHQDVVLTSPKQGDGYTPGAPVTFTGSATPGASVEIKSKYSGATLTSTKAGLNGEWNVKRTFGPSAIYNLDIVATDADGTTSSAELLNFGPVTK